MHAIYTMSSVSYTPSSNRIRSPPSPSKVKENEKILYEILFSITATFPFNLVSWNYLYAPLTSPNWRSTMTAVVMISGPQT